MTYSYLRVITYLSLSILLTACGRGAAVPDSSKVSIIIERGQSSNSASAPNLRAASVTASVVFTVSALDMATITSTVSVTSTSTVSVDLEVPNGNQRKFSAVALDATGTAIYSGSTTVDLSGVPISLSINLLPIALSQPSDVTASSGNGQNTISWSAVTGAVSYNIYYSTSSGVTTTSGTKIAGVSSPYTHSNLTNGTTYYYIVTAVNAGVESAASLPVSAMPQVVVAAPGQPVASASAGTGQNTVTWNTVTGATSYNIYYSTASGVTTTSGTKIAGATSPYTHSNLTNGTTYYYIVTAVNDGGESTASSPVSAMPQVAAPGQPVASASAGTGQNTIAWNAVTGATSYNIYFATASGVTTTSGTKIAGVTSPYTHSNLTNGTTYYYIVTAVNDGGESAASSPVSARPQVAAPGQPAASASAGNGQNTIAWNAVTGATSYNIYFATASGVTTTSGTKIAAVTSPYTHISLVNGTTYYYIVTAVNDGGESTASSPVSAMPQVAAPGQPVASASAGTAQNTVTWNAVTGATSYNIYFATTSGVTTTSGTKIAGVTSPYTHSNLTNGTTYYYIVTAVNDGGESTASSPVSAMPQVAAPGQPVASASAGTAQNTVTWNAVTGATSYNIYFATTSGVTTTSGTKIAGVTSPYTHSNLTNGTTYYYIVTAVNDGGESTASSPVSAMPQVAAPGQPAASASAGNGQNTIAWNAVTGATSYNIYFATASGVTTTSGTKIAAVTSPYTHISLVNGTTYYYIVTAVNDGGESAASSPVSARPQVPSPGPPTGVSASAGNAQATISWTAPAGTITSYTVYYSTSSSVNTSASTPVTGITGTSKTITSLTNGQTYYFIVTAVNAGGESAASSSVSATPNSTALVGTADDDYAHAVTQDASGNIFIAGTTYGDFNAPATTHSLNPANAFASKFDASGYKIWTRQFGAALPSSSTLSLSTAAFGVAADAAGNVIVVGMTGGNIFETADYHGSGDCFVTKLNTSGSASWTRLIGGSKEDLCNAVAVDASGNIYVTGFTNSGLDDYTSSGKQDVFVAKFDTSGNKQWLKQFGTADDDSGEAIAVDNSGNVYVTGNTDGTFPSNTTKGNKDIFITKINQTNGSVITTVQFGNPGADNATSIAVDNNHSVLYVAGKTDSYFGSSTNQGLSDIFVAKFASDLLSSPTVFMTGTAGNDEAQGIAVDSSGNVFVTGTTNGTFADQTSAGGYDSFVIKFSSTGTMAWVRQKGSVNHDDGNAILVDTNGNAHVAGSAKGVFNSLTTNGFDAFSMSFDTSGM